MEEFGLMAGSSIFILSCSCGWFILNLFILAWVYRDARDRGENGALWVLITLFGGIIGLIVWFMVRPPKGKFKRKLTDGDVENDSWYGTPR
jgi:hypothetical protein